MKDPLFIARILTCMSMINVFCIYGSYTHAIYKVCFNLVSSFVIPKSYKVAK